MTNTILYCKAVTVKVVKIEELHKLENNWKIPIAQIKYLDKDYIDRGTN